jgi:hypothetical protein
VLACHALRSYAFHACIGLLVAATILVVSSVAILPVPPHGGAAHRAARAGHKKEALAMSRPARRRCRTDRRLVRANYLMGDLTGSRSGEQFRGLPPGLRHSPDLAAGIALFWTTRCDLLGGEFVGLQHRLPGWDLFTSHVAGSVAPVAP